MLNPNTQSGATYHETTVTMTMDLVGNVDGPASVFGDGYLAVLLWLEVPYGVVVFRVVKQLLDGQWGHGWW